jgi:HPr kinase/phosphorylase
MSSLAPQELTVETLLAERGREMDLSVIGGSSGLSNRISTPELNRPGLAFAGFYDVFAYDRIQVLGNTEMSYLRSLPKEDRAKRLEHTFGFRIPCIIITNANEMPRDAMEIADRHGIPLLGSSLPTTRLVSLLNTYLERVFAPMVNVHAVLLDVYGMGTLLMGTSGVGKSECALELIERGHRLIADDFVILRRLSKDMIIGRGADVVKHHMEIRGLGILNIELMFGVASVAEEKQIDLVIQLERWDDSVEYERLGIDDRYGTFFDVDIPEYVIPVQPGRNISIMVEMAALTQRLKNTGHHPARMLEQVLLARMSAETPSPGGSSK